MLSLRIVLYSLRRSAELLWRGLCLRIQYCAALVLRQSDASFVSSLRATFYATGMRRPFDAENFDGTTPGQLVSADGVAHIPVAIGLTRFFGSYGILPLRDALTTFVSQTLRKW